MALTAALALAALTALVRAAAAGTVLGVYVFGAEQMLRRLSAGACCRDRYNGNNASSPTTGVSRDLVVVSQLGVNGPR